MTLWGPLNLFFLRCLFYVLYFKIVVRVFRHFRPGHISFNYGDSIHPSGPFVRFLRGVQDFKTSWDFVEFTGILGMSWDFTYLPDFKSDLVHFVLVFPNSNCQHASKYISIIDTC